MAGIGKNYEKGVKFTLKSGNKPSFFQMGSDAVEKARISPLRDEKELTAEEKRAKEIKMWQRKDDASGKTDELMREQGHEAWYRKDDGTIVAGTEDFVAGVKSGKIKESKTKK